MTDETDKAPDLPKVRYSPSFARIALNAMESGLASSKTGAIVQPLADLFGVSNGTISTWRKKHREFYLATEYGEDVRVRMVEDSLFHSATGYSAPETKVHYDADLGEHRTLTIEKHFKPDVNAAKFFLMNRAPDRWSLNPDAVQGERTIVVERVTSDTVMERREREALDSQREMQAALKEARGS